MLGVGTSPPTLCVAYPHPQDAERPNAIPTQSVGTIKDWLDPNHLSIARLTQEGRSQNQGGPEETLVAQLFS